MDKRVLCHAADMPAKLECYISPIRGAALDAADILGSLTL